ncbi:cytochrome P450 [Nocardia vinacea]|uniref:Cytochrome P450 n=1 Tax=Nocardia vinacea TaxID=96468 RepID=A0ABZ1Z035_9NOCA|nr:cytochrome P450 [Nocardia vinacea]
MISTLTKHLTGAVAAVALRMPVAERDLATPPTGSGLAPVRGDAGLPLLGYSLNVFDDLLGLQRVLYRRYGPVHWVSAFGTRLVIALGQEAVGEVLANRDKAFANAGWARFLGPFFHRGIMLMDFDEHMYHRRIMQQAFTRPRLIGYLEMMNPAIERALDTWRPADDFPIYRNGKQLALDIATSVFVGAELGPEAAELHRAFTATVAGGLAVVRADIPGGRWHAGLQGRRMLERYFRDRVSARRFAPTNEIFSVLCRAHDETGARFTDDDVVNHMIFLMMAAHDTTSTTLAMMTYYLAEYPEWQDRARAESRALDKSAIDFVDLDRLTVLDLVLKESLRMCAPVGMLARETVHDTELLGHFVPAGTLVGVAVAASHRMEPWWRDPDIFDPERFAEPRREDRNHRSAFAPFGSGAHKCIGMHFGAMEVKAILHQMLLRFTWSVPEGYEPPIGYLTGPYPTDGLPIRITHSRT